MFIYIKLEKSNKQEYIFKKKIISSLKKFKNFPNLI